MICEKSRKRWTYPLPLTRCFEASLEWPRLLPLDLPTGAVGGGSVPVVATSSLSAWPSPETTQIHSHKLDCFSLSQRSFTTLNQLMEKKMKLFQNSVRWWINNCAHNYESGPSQKIKKLVFSYFMFHLF